MPAVLGMLSGMEPRSPASRWADFFKTLKAVWIQLTPGEAGKAREDLQGEPRVPTICRGALPDKKTPVDMQMTC